MRCLHTHISEREKERGREVETMAVMDTRHLMATFWNPQCS